MIRDSHGLYTLCDTIHWLLRGLQRFWGDKGKPRSAHHAGDAPATQVPPRCEARPEEDGRRIPPRVPISFLRVFLSLLGKTMDGHLHSFVPLVSLVGKTRIHGTSLEKKGIRHLQTGRHGPEERHLSLQPRASQFFSYLLRALGDLCGSTSSRLSSRPSRLAVILGCDPRRPRW
jgi:hypothetical protein